MRGTWRGKGSGRTVLVVSALVWGWGWWSAGGVAGAGPGAGSAKAPAGADLAGRIVGATGVSGGLCVVVGARDARLAVVVARAGRFLVHGLAVDEEALERARRSAAGAGLAGRVSFARWEPGRLPYDDDLVNLLLVDAGLAGGGPAPAEVKRVLAPRGVVCLAAPEGREEAEKGRLRAAGLEEVRALPGLPGFVAAVKPRPAEMDDWSHPRHGPDANAVSGDTLAGPPGSLRWIAGPGWPVGHPGGPKGMVAAGGRFFAVFNEAPPYVLAPAKMRLIARDAYNGLLLWKRDIPRPVSRRSQVVTGGWLHPLVATAERVYTVLDRNEPLVALEAATGRTVRAYPDAGAPAQLVLAAGRLVLAGGGPVRALDPASGKLLWSARDAGYWPLAADGRVFYRAGHEIVAVDAKTGRELWRTGLKTFTGERAEPSGYYRGVLFLAVAYGGKAVYALSAETGRHLWTYTYTHPGHGGSKKNVFGRAGLAWVHSARVTGRLDRRRRPIYSYSLVGLDPLTGEVKKTIEYCTYSSSGGKTPQRCHLDIATERYYITGSTDFIEWSTGRHVPVSVARGACDSGFLVANGLFYTPPHPCACRPFVRGFAAFVPARPTPRGGGAGGQGSADIAPRSGAGRLVKGPAFGAVRGGDASTRPGPDDWPTWRHDPARSASTGSAVSLPLSLLWKRPLGGRLSAPTVAGGMVFLAAGDRHQVIALDAATGQTRWSYTAGARVDTPPTLFGGLCLFGSADGWVYCLRSADGALVWRFRAAPGERLVIDHEQLASAWPVHGAVLVEGGKVFCAAGRHSRLDGGIRLYALEPATGKALWERVLGPGGGREGLNDVLVGDGRSVYLYYHWKVDPATGSDSGAARRPHLRPAASMGGLLEEEWSRRSYGGPRQSDIFSVGGELIAFAPDLSLAVTGFQGRGRDVRFVPGRGEFRLTARRGRARRGGKPLWTVRLPVRARSLVRAGGVVFAAGPPDPVDERIQHLTDRRRILALLARTPELLAPRGGRIIAYSADEGRVLQQFDLPAAPVDEGLAAAAGRLFASLADGSVVCLGRK